MRYLKEDIKIDYKKAGCEHDEYQPYLQCYIHEESKELPLKRKRAAVIICPGGGFNFCSDRESEPVALAYLSHGIQAFVLRYSVVPNHFPSAFLELAESVKYVREHAEEYSIDTERIFVSGFSAGGHIAGSLGTKWMDPVLRDYYEDNSPKPVWKPSGMILGYSVLTLGEYTHEVSMHNILGDRMDVREDFCLEKAVDKNTVPLFIWHTFEDAAVPLENTLMFISAMRKNGIPFEAHIYERGCHGLALCNEQTAATEAQIQPDNENWFEMAVKWIDRF